MIDHIEAQVCALVVSSSSPCLMRTLTNSLRPLNLPHFLSLHHLQLPALPAPWHIPLPWCRRLKPRALPLRCRVTRTVRTPPQILWLVTEVCSNQGFLPGQWKNDLKQRPRGNLMPKRYLHGPMTWKGHAKNCVERNCELAKKRRNNFQSRDAMLGWSSIQRRRKWISGRLVYSFVTNCSCW